jgi:hypothetical protein
MKNTVVLVTLVMALATLVLTHLTIAVRLLLRVKPRYRGLLALLVPPLAPVWAYGQRWRRLCWLWLAAVLIYAAALVAGAL